MSDGSDEVFWGVISLIGVVIVILFFWKVWPKIWPDHFMDLQIGYCLEDKKIVKADPIFEDNGKYEDESYRVTYEDGSVGLVDNAQLRTGKVCTKTVSYYENDPRAQGLTKVADY